MMTDGSSADPTVIATRLVTLAARLAQFAPENPDELTMQGHLVAALYALYRAVACESAEVTAPAAPLDEELRAVAAALIDEGTTGDAPWLAEFYLAVAEYRLSLIPPKLKQYRTVEAHGFPHRRRRRIQLGTQTGRIDEIVAAIGQLEQFLDILLPE